MRTATIEQLITRARAAINSDNDLIYDVASESGQIVGNVKHMHWFVMAVAKEIACRTKKYAHLLELAEVWP